MCTFVEPPLTRMILVGNDWFMKRFITELTTVLLSIAKPLWQRSLPHCPLVPFHCNHGASFVSLFRSFTRILSLSLALALALAITPFLSLSVSLWDLLLYPFPVRAYFYRHSSVVENQHTSWRANRRFPFNSLVIPLPPTRLLLLRLLIKLLRARFFSSFFFLFPSSSRRTSSDFRTNSRDKKKKETEIFIRNKLGNSAISHCGFSQREKYRGQVGNEWAFASVEKNCQLFRIDVGIDRRDSRLRFAR